jgi:hypothetical protein
MVMIVFGSILLVFSLIGFVAVLGGKSADPLSSTIAYFVVLLIGLVLFYLGVKRRSKKPSIRQNPSQQYDQNPSAPTPVASVPVKARGNEHYVLQCKECDFTYHIPRDRSESNFSYFVDLDRVKISCVYGPHADARKLVISLTVKDFFTITTSAEPGKGVHAAVGKNIEPLHDHMILHHDPLFLEILQYSYQTDHIYNKEPQGRTYIRFSKTQGTDIVGNVDVSKAYIPGVS